MRKQFLMAVGALVMAGAGMAQVSIGVQTGANLSSAKTKNSTAGEINGKFVTGFHGGLVADIALTPELSAMPTLSFIQKGTEASRETTQLGITTKVEQETSINYLELPLNFVYHFDLGESARFFVGAGPSFSYALSGKTKSSVSSPLGTNTSEDDLKFGSGQTDNFKRFDLGGNGIAGVKLNNGFAVSVNYTHSFTNLSPVDNFSYKGRSLGLTLNYFFNSNTDK